MTCAHGMPSPASCVECMNEGVMPPPPHWERIGEPFVARYPTECRGCHREVKAGEWLQRYDRGTALNAETAYVHRACWP